MKRFVPIGSTIVLLLGFVPGCTERPRGVAPHPVGVDVPPPLPAAPPRPSAEGLTLVGPGFPEAGPWVSFYGNAEQMKSPERVAQAFRVINIDADPAEENFTDAQIEILKAGGKNRVLSYLNVGSCENTRSYWAKAPNFVPCAANKEAQRGAYDGYPDETWMDPGVASYRNLIVHYVAARIAARKVDGFYLDNLEMIEHSSTAKTGACDARCKQGVLDLVRELRETYPTMLIVMQNATSDATRLATTGGAAFPTLLDGIAHEEVYRPKRDRDAEQELMRWRQMSLHSRSGHPFWIGVEDYVGSCSNTEAAAFVFENCKQHGFSAYVSDESAGQKVICYWGR
jgi:cysteinyl-tRNA synthetase